MRNVYVPARWIILDAMGVIFEVGDDTNDLLVPFIRERNPLISKERINELYLEASLGRMSSREFWSEVGFGGRYPEVEEHYLNTCLRLDPGFKEAAEKLLRSYSLAMHSNDLKESSVYLRALFDLDRYFHAVIVSGDVGFRKPDRRIFDIFMDVAGAGPKDCVFVDDRSKNLRAASELGFRTVQFMREDSDSAFQPDFAVRSFAELPRAVNKVFEQQPNRGMS